MRSRTAAALLASLGITAGGAALTVAPALAQTSSPAVVDTTPDDTTDDATTATEEESTTGSDSAVDETGAETADEAADSGESWLVAALQPLVDDGTITQDQADAVVTAIVDARPARVGVARVLVNLDVLTDVLGVTAEELRTAFQEGQSIADVATAQGVDVQTVIDALVAAGTERIDAAVADGRLTAEEGATRTAELIERVTALVNQAGGPRFGRWQHGGGNGPGAGGPMVPGHGGNGPMGPGSADPAAPPADDSATTNTAEDPATADTTDTTTAADA